MKRIRQGWNALRQNRRSGVSLIVALCAVAVLIGLSLSIVYSSSMILSRANRKIGRERCYQLAQSFSLKLKDELYAYNTENTELSGEGVKLPSRNDTFYSFANKVIDQSADYPEYDPDNPQATTYPFATGSTDDEYGKITVSLRKVSGNTGNTGNNNSSDDDPAQKEGMIYYNTFNNQVDTDDVNQAIDERFTNPYTLVVSVTVELGVESYTYTMQYQRQDSYDPIFTWKGKNEDDTAREFRIYWPNDGQNQFSLTKNGTDYITPNEAEQADGFTITYKYDTSQMTYKRYSLVTEVSANG